MNAAFNSERVSTAIRALFAALDAELIDLDVLQPADVYFDLSGEDVRQRIFVIENSGGQSLCLRPDLTVPASRHYLKTHPTCAPATLRYEGKAFRYVPSGVGRAAEFVQMGVEFFQPEDGDLAEQQCFDLAAQSLAAGGVRDAHYMFGDGSLLARFIAGLGVSKAVSERLLRIFQRKGQLHVQESDEEPASVLAKTLSATPAKERELLLQEMMALSQIAPVGERPLGDIVERLLSREIDQPGSDELREAARACAPLIDWTGPLAAAPDAIAAIAKSQESGLGSWADEWSARIARTRNAGIDGAEFSVRFARAFHYYDGPVFECRYPALGDRQTLGGGGHFRQLLKRLGADDGVSALGMAVRPARIARAGSMSQ
jgi:ATP phosphoribosyltransferase regulatory subunit